MVNLLEAEPEFLDSCDGLIIKKSQAITSDLLDQTSDMRHYTGRERDLMPVASVPTLVVELWLKQGFDINYASAREIVERLRKEDLGAFITTSKRV